MMKLTFQCKKTPIFLFGVTVKGVKWTYTTLVLNTKHKVVINFVTYTIICFTKLFVQINETVLSLIRSRIPQQKPVVDDLPLFS